MITTYRLDADSLNASILRSIKEAFKGREIEIVIFDADSNAEERKLLQRVRNLDRGVNTTEFDMQEFLSSYRQKIADAESRV